MQLYAWVIFSFVSLSLFAMQRINSKEFYLSFFFYFDGFYFTVSRKVLNIYPEAIFKLFEQDYKCSSVQEHLPSKHKFLRLHTHHT